VSEVPRVEESSLNVLGPLGSGGQATVYRVELAGPASPLAGRALAYKAYPPAALAQLQVAALEALIRLPGQVADAEPGWLAARASWPLAAVTRAGAVCGLLMEVAPAEFNSGRTTADGATVVQGLEFLLNPPEYLARLGLPVTERQRLQLLAHFAATVSWLHAQQAAIGDLSPKNVLVSLTPTVRTYLIDCDAALVHGASVLPQMDTPDWALPGGEPSGTIEGDRYKFGLLALRLLASDQSTRSLDEVPARLPELRRLIAQALSAEPQRRPAAPEWAAAVDHDLPLADTTPPLVTAPIVVPVPLVAAGPAPLPWAPTPAPAAGTGGPRRRLAILAVVLALLGCTGVGGIISWHGSHSSAAAPVGAPAADGGPAAAASSSADNGSLPGDPTGVADTPTPGPTAVGLVDLSAVPDDPRAPAVATMLNTYFAGINARSYDDALSVFDPAGSVDPRSSRQRQAFIDGVTTSQDSDIHLLGLGDAAPPAALTAHVSFRSGQQPGYGPKGDRQQTCTDWDLRYALSQAGDGRYLLLRTVSAAHSAC
jgi:hypothetical protein